MKVIVGLVGAGLLALSNPALAQPNPRRASSEAAAQPTQAQPQISRPPIDALTVSRLVWSSLAALDHANQTGNYSVLRDLGAPTFQANNSAATLASIFERIRSAQVDLGYAFNVNPVWEFAPSVLPNGLLRARGSFPLRPTAISFDMLFENVNGQWRLFGIAVAPSAMRDQTPTGR